MKIKVQEIDFDQLEFIPSYEHRLPKKQNFFLKKLVEGITSSDLKATNFKANYIGMEGLKKKEPCLILMNHSSFIDLKIVFRLFKDRPFNIVTTDDGLVGKEGLMRSLGCIPTKKFLPDMSLYLDIEHCIKKLHSSVLMYPEATYSFDGRSALLPDSVGRCVKKLGAPVVLITTHGAFLRDPLYNNLQLRQTDVSADVELLLTKEKIEAMSSEEINQLLREKFCFDAFKEQKELHIRIDEPFRADYLHRILYRCPSCGKEGGMKGKGIHLTCASCGAKYELDEYGSLKKEAGDSEYLDVPSWYDYQKDELAKEIEESRYRIDAKVDIFCLKNLKTLYHVGEGKLVHSEKGFVLDGCQGRLHFEQSNRVSYSLYSDYYWYELGDMICIGNDKIRYYCIIKDGQDLASKARLAVQYLFKKEKAAI